MNNQYFDNTVNKESFKSEPKEFKEPRLKFIEPKLTRHGDATKITGSFFGTFIPPR